MIDPDLSKINLKIGILGTGIGTVLHYPGLNLHPNFSPVIIAGRDKAKTKSIAEKIGIEKFTTNWKDVIDNPEIDAVVIATPPNLHNQMALYALENGKHVICEKPLAMNVEEAQAMFDACELSGKIGMINLQFRYLPTRTYFLELLKNNYTGRIYQFDIKVRNDSRLNPLTQGYNWWSNEDEGGGILLALGSHYIDFVHQIFGKINNVFGRRTIHVPRRLNKLTGRMKNVSSDDAVSCIFDVGENTVGTISISTTTAFGHGSRIEAYGEEGTLVIRENGTVWGAKLSEDKELKHLPIPSKHQLEQLDEHNNLLPPYLKFLDQFAKSVLSGKSLSPNFSDGLKIQKVLDGIRESNKKNKMIKIEY